MPEVLDERVLDASRMKVINDDGGGQVIQPSVIPLLCFGIRGVALAV
jgi:hypothetical protein